MGSTMVAYVVDRQSPFAPIRNPAIVVPLQPANVMVSAMLSKNGFETMVEAIVGWCLRGGSSETRVL